jgi:inorganic pyrophosphatase
MILKKIDRMETLKKEKHLAHYTESIEAEYIKHYRKLKVFLMAEIDNICEEYKKVDIYSRFDVWTIMWAYEYVQ